MKLSRVVTCGIALLFGWSLRATGQQFAVYGEATGATLQFQETSHMYGGTFGFYDMKPVGPVSMGADFRGVMVKRGGTNGSINDQKLDAGQFGFRISASKGVLPFSMMPYGEAMIGLGYWRGGVGVLRQDKTHALMQGLVGIDVPVFRSVQWRVVEFSYGRAGAQPGFINPEMISTGIVIQLPRAGSPKH